MIRFIQESDWPQIMAIQSDVYLDVTPESLHVLQKKWHRSPDFCFVYEEREKVVAYLLAHTWSGALPKLDTVLDFSVSSKWVLLHDLAVSEPNKGIGKSMIRHFLSVVSWMAYTQIKLVSIQNSASFWASFGFKRSSGSVSDCYGSGALLMIRSES